LAPVAPAAESGKDTSLRRSALRAGLPWVLPVFTLSAWELLARAGVLRANLLPAPSRVLGSLLSLQQQHVLAGHLTATCLRVLAGFVLGASAATLLGALTGRSKLAHALLDPSLQALRNIPSLAWVPLFLLWLGIQEASKVALIAVGVFFPVYLNLVSGRRWRRQQLQWFAAMGKPEALTRPLSAGNSDVSDCRSTKARLSSQQLLSSPAELWHSMM
jgi:ABC-type nitrate/sulfonate/bicarbonate transport system permease component